MDVGTAFGGIGASREMTFVTFAEPALLLVIFTLALLAGTTNLDPIATLLREGALGLRVSLGLARWSRRSRSPSPRMPASRWTTRRRISKLTMVHEAMVLEYSGRDLALMEYGAALKLLLWLYADRGHVPAVRRGAAGRRTGRLGRSGCWPGR